MWHGTGGDFRRVVQLYLLWLFFAAGRLGSAEWRVSPRTGTTRGLPELQRPMHYGSSRSLLGGTETSMRLQYPSLSASAASFIPSLPFLLNALTRHVAPAAFATSSTTYEAHVLGADVK
ncbi:hypothetical protein B0H19DRAFT_685585 [Mycena capillaripes]|nr:hypothetical protein B0H19DRAFT_685585 [Mycena capillaripes]